MDLSRSYFSGGTICGRELSSSSILVSDCADRGVAFVAGKYIFRSESNLIPSVAACSNMIWASLSPVNTWNYF